MTSQPDSEYRWVRTRSDVLYEPRRVLLMMAVAALAAWGFGAERWLAAALASLFAVGVVLYVAAFLYFRRTRPELVRTQYLPFRPGHYHVRYNPPPPGTRIILDSRDVTEIAAECHVEEGWVYLFPCVWRSDGTVRVTGKPFRAMGKVELFHPADLLK